MADRLTNGDEESANELLALAYNVGLKGFVHRQNAAGCPTKTNASATNRAKSDEGSNAPRSTGRFSDVALADSVEDILELAKEMGLKGFTDEPVAGE